MSTVTIHEAKAQLSKLIEAVLSGEEVIIARRNRPLVRLVALNSGTTPRTLETAEGKIWIADDFDALPADFADYV